MDNRNYKIDLLRIIACIMVIGIHAPQKGLEYSGMFLVGSAYLFKPCIGLFFMVSGYLLLPVKLSYKDFVKKRLNKVLLPTLFFSLFYIILKTVYLQSVTSLWSIDVLKSICSVPFHYQGSNVLWFMYPLIGIYLVAPLISLFLENASKKEFQFLLFIWLISLTLNALSNYIDVTLDVEGGAYYFYGYIGYFTLGYYLKRFPIRIPFWFFPVLLIVPFAVRYLDKVYELNIDSGNLSIPCVMMCIAWFQFIFQYINPDKWSSGSKRIIASFSNCSFGIYLIHSLVLFYFLWNIHLPIDGYPIFRFILNVILTALLSWILSILISKTKVGRYLIGFTSIKQRKD